MRSAFRGSLPRLLLIAAIAYGALLRLGTLLADPDFVSPDARRHFDAAEELFLTEPSSWLAVERGYLPFAYWNRLLFGLLFHHPIIQRLGTVILSVVLIGLIAWTATRLHGVWAGVFAAYLAALCPPLIEFSASGLRTDFQSCLWIGLFFFLFVWRPNEEKERARWLIAGLLGWLIFLVRLDSLAALVAIALLAGMVRGVWRMPRHLAPALILVSLLTALLLAANAARFDDAFHFIDKQKNTFRYWANLEFQGTPGFPTEEEVRAYSRTGAPISAFEYFGSVLGWRETASRFYRGYRSLFLGNVGTGIYTFTAFPNQIGAAGVLTLIGLGLSLWWREWALPALLPLIVLGTVWTYHIPGGRDFRFFLPIIPIAILLAARGGVWCWNRIGNIKMNLMRWTVQLFLLALVVLNPWNHDLDRSFPWREGPVAWLPKSAERDPVALGDSLALVGWELRKIGPLGLWSRPFEKLRAGQRFRITLYWKSIEEVVDSGSYIVALHQEELGEFGSLRPHPLAEKFPCRYWRPGQIIRDEIEYVVFPRVPPGTTSVVLKVYGAGLIQETTAELATFEVLPIGWSLVDPRNWG